MLKTKKYTAVLPFWPLSVADSQNYFLYPLQTAKKQGYQTDKLINPYPGQVLTLLQSNRLFHFQTTYHSILAALTLCLLKNRKAKIIWTPHLAFNLKQQTSLPYNLIKLLKPLMQKLDRIITITPYEHQYFHSLGYTNLTYLPLAINTKLLPSSTFRSNSLELIFFGGDRLIKNLLPVLKTFTILQQLRLNPQLHILDPIKPSFIHQHQRLFRSNIKLYGRLPHLSAKFKQLLSQANYYINNSLAEGSPLAAYEAAFAGVNCCLSSLPTLKNIFGLNALFHHPDKPDQLTHNLLHYYYNPHLAFAHRRTNYQLMQQLSLKIFEKKFIKLLNKLL